MGKYFGTDGFRGKAGEGLTAAHAYEIGRFWAGTTAGPGGADRGGQGHPPLQLYAGGRPELQG